jgi:gluconolactonase
MTTPAGPPQAVVEGLSFPEGPTALGDGSIACVEMQGGRLTRVHPDGRLQTLAEIGGGPNGSALGADGALYVADNGGLSMQVDGRGYWWASDPRDGCVHRVGADGTVTRAGADFPGPAPHRPNDLVTGPDGAIYATDSGNWEDMGNLRSGAIVRIDGHETTQVADLAGMPNGIVATADRLLVAQSLTRRIWSYPFDDGRLGEPTEFVRLASGIPDGMCLADDGTLFVCASVAHTVVIVGPDGALRGEISTGDGTQPTNCCLDDGYLYITLALTGALVRLEVGVGPAASFAAAWEGSKP